MAALFGFESNRAAIEAEAAARAFRIFSFLDGRPFFVPGTSAASETSSIRSGTGSGAPTGLAERMAGGRISIFGRGAGAGLGAMLRVGIGSVDGGRTLTDLADSIAGGKTFILIRE